MSSVFGLKLDIVVVVSDPCEHSTTISVRQKKWLSNHWRRSEVIMSGRDAFIKAQCWQAVETLGRTDVKRAEYDIKRVWHQLADNFFIFL